MREVEDLLEHPIDQAAQAEFVTRTAPLIPPAVADLRRWSHGYVKGIQILNVDVRVMVLVGS